MKAEVRSRLCSSKMTSKKLSTSGWKQRSPNPSGKGEQTGRKGPATIPCPSAEMQLGKSGKSHHLQKRLWGPLQHAPIGVCRGSRRQGGEKRGVLCDWSGSLGAGLQGTREEGNWHHHPGTGSTELCSASRLGDTDFSWFWRIQSVRASDNKVPLTVSDLNHLLWYIFSGLEIRMWFS